jgi:hypothetical protein
MKRADRRRNRAASSTFPNRPDRLVGRLVFPVVGKTAPSFARRQGGQVMKKFLAPLLAAVAAFALAPAARAEVEKVELDVAGYLCGL